MRAGSQEKGSRGVRPRPDPGGAASPPLGSARAPETGWRLLNQRLALQRGAGSPLPPPRPNHRILGGRRRGDCQTSRRLRRRSGWKNRGTGGGPPPNPHLVFFFIE